MGPDKKVRQWYMEARPGCTKAGAYSNGRLAGGSGVPGTVGLQNQGSLMVWNDELV